MTEANEVLGGATLVEALRLGERQAHGPLAVFPVCLGAGDGPGYITLREAIAVRQFEPRRRFGRRHLDARLNEDKARRLALLLLEDLPAGPRSALEREAQRGVPPETLLQAIVALPEYQLS